MFIDSHAHVDDIRYAEDRAEVLARARETGVEMILEICNGDIETGSLERGLELVAANPDMVAALGVHPHDAKLYSPELEARLRRLADNPKVVAWGEIGLDFYYDNSPREVQRSAFIRQMEVADELGLPIIIHTRDADEETITLLTTHWGRRERAGIFHCFSGGPALAEAALDLGFLISFSGNVTFKKAQELRDIAAWVPLDRMLIETDCPYLTPEPFRGKRNEPARVREVAAKLGELRGLSVEEIGHFTTGNFRRFFRMEHSLSAED
ncbi:MAG: TatD family hydrolase [Blastocatellia bacterium]|nr:TatD family hydrolase [Blastocatellia bacterium]